MTSEELRALASLITDLSDLSDWASAPRRAYALNLRTARTGLSALIKSIEASK